MPAPVARHPKPGRSLVLPLVVPIHTRTPGTSPLNSPYLPDPTSFVPDHALTRAGGSSRETGASSSCLPAVVVIEPAPDRSRRSAAREHCSAGRPAGLIPDSSRRPPSSGQPSSAFRTGRRPPTMAVFSSVRASPPLSAAHCPSGARPLPSCRTGSSGDSEPLSGPLGLAEAW